jgi:anti-sigma-K factor RskA
MSTNASLSPEPTLPEKDRRVSPWWRALAYVLAIVLGLAIASAMSMFEQFKAQIGHMQKQLQAVEQIKSIAVLTDELHAPAMLITQDPQEFTLQLQRLNAVTEGQEDSMQLWALSGTARPKSLGVLTAKLKTQRLNASDKDLANIDTLAISVENRGGVDPAKGPRLPYLFQGAVIQKSR